MCNDMSCEVVIKNLCHTIDMDVPLVGKGR
jgi:hypothetical protein